jgi:hypothetical protein
VSAGGNCAEVMACGGDVTGTWKITSTCVSGANSTDIGTCAGETLQVDSVDFEGTITFDTGGTYEESLTSGSVAETLTVPTSCLGGAACTASSSDAGISGVCGVSGSNCVCSVSISQTSNTASGTYSTSGSMITVTPAGDTATSDGYCVQGNTLTLLGSVSTTMSASGSAAVVLTRQ